MIAIQRLTGLGYPRIFCQFLVIVWDDKKVMVLAQLLFRLNNLMIFALNKEANVILLIENDFFDKLSFQTKENGK